ncbi:rCG58282 [Rattus norvegicus]|nr:rCG58282 [Rattus norvegicus]
MLQMTP